MKSTNDTKENSALSPVGVTRRRLLKGSAAGLVGATVAAPFINKQALGASKPIELTVGSCCGTAQDSQGGMLKFWGDEMEKQTGGEVKVVQYNWSGSLVKWSNTAKSVQTGVVDVADFANNSVAGLMPLCNALEPVFRYEGYGQGYFHVRSYNEFPELRAEFHKMNQVPLYWLNGGIGSLMTSFTHNSVEDLKGKKIRVSGPAKFFVQNLGGIPVSVPALEVPIAIQKGTVDGAVFGPQALETLGMAEVVKQVTNFRASCYDMWVGATINLDTYNRMSDVAKETIPELAALVPDLNRKASLREILVGLERSRKAGVDIVQLSRKEAKKWNDKVNPSSIDDAYAKVAEEKGHPYVREYMKQVIAWQDEWEAENPFRTAFEIFGERNPGTVRIIGDA